MSKLQPIDTTSLCSLGCNNVAKFVSKSNKLYCNTSPNKCPIVKSKNSLGVSKAHSEGKIPGWSQLRADGRVKDPKGLFNFEITTTINEEDIFCYGGKGSHKAILIKERGHCCESCNNSSWLNLPITLELEHVDGIKSNNVKENLKLLCPNCHSQTPTWRKKKTKNQGLKHDIESYVEAVQSSKNAYQVCEKLKLAATPSTYASIYKIMLENNLKFAI